MTSFSSHGAWSSAEATSTPESAAAALIEAGNALQLPGRPRAPIQIPGQAMLPAGDFDKFAQQLTAEAILAKAAAEKHDKAAAYSEGAKLYLICTACHAEYILANNIAATGTARASRMASSSVT